MDGGPIGPAFPIVKARGPPIDARIVSFVPFRIHSLKLFLIMCPSSVLSLSLSQQSYPLSLRVSFQLVTAGAATS